MEAAVEEVETTVVVAAAKQAEEEEVKPEVAAGIVIRGDSHFAETAQRSQGKRRKKPMY